MRRLIRKIEGIHYVFIPFLSPIQRHFNYFSLACKRAWKHMPRTYFVVWYTLSESNCVKVQHEIRTTDLGCNMDTLHRIWRRIPCTPCLPAWWYWVAHNWYFYRRTLTTLAPRKPCTRSTNDGKSFRFYRKDVLLKNRFTAHADQWDPTTSPWRTTSKHLLLRAMIPRQFNCGCFEWITNQNPFCYTD